jgi:hypothetical protein
MKIADHLFLIDATTSMRSTIKAAHQKAKDIATSAKSEFPDVKFRFGCICYRDPVNHRKDVHQIHLFNENIEKLIAFLETVTAKGGGGDGPEDFVGAFQNALDLNWNETSSKTITLIADAPPHGKLFCGFENHEDQVELLLNLLKEVASRKIYLSVISLNNGIDSAKTIFENIFKQQNENLIQWESFAIKKHSKKHHKKHHHNEKQNKKEHNNEQAKTKSVHESKNHHSTSKDVHQVSDSDSSDNESQIASKLYGSSLDVIRTSQSAISTQKDSLGSKK